MCLTCTPAGLEEAYISYEVVTTTSLPHFSRGRLSVRRRFRDVVSLSNLLPKLLHGRYDTAHHTALIMYITAYLGHTTPLIASRSMTCIDSCRIWAQQRRATHKGVRGSWGTYSMLSCLIVHHAWNTRLVTCSRQQCAGGNVAVVGLMQQHVRRNRQQHVGEGAAPGSCKPTYQY
jgi:hypothetical protein